MLRVFVKQNGVHRFECQPILRSKQPKAIPEYRCGACERGIIVTKVGEFCRCCGSEVIGVLDVIECNPNAARRSIGQIAEDYAAAKREHVLEGA